MKRFYILIVFSLFFSSSYGSRENSYDEAKKIYRQYLLEKAKDKNRPKPRITNAQCEKIFWASLGGLTLFSIALPASLLFINPFPFLTKVLGRSSF
jgi:hypothetical protein